MNYGHLPSSYLDPQLKLPSKLLRHIRLAIISVFVIHISISAVGATSRDFLSIPLYFNNWSYVLALFHLIFFAKTEADKRLTRRFSALYFAALWSNILFAFIYWTVFLLGNSSRDDHPTSAMTVSLPLLGMMVESVINRVHITPKNKWVGRTVVVTYLSVNLTHYLITRKSVYGTQFHWNQSETYVMICLAVLWGCIFDQCIELHQSQKFISKCDLLFDASVKDTNLTRPF